jgi:hypothetical protein
LTTPTSKSAAQKLRAQLTATPPESRGDRIVREFLEQLDAYYASPNSSFYDNAIARRFYEQKLRYLKFTPYPNDGLVTFGASGTNKCDREVVFKYGDVKPEKSDDLPFRGRQRRQGTANIELLQLDLVHMEKRLGERAKFKVAEVDRIERHPVDDVFYTEWLLEDAAQKRKIFEYPHPETGELVRFAITAKPDGILDYEGDRLIFEYKTKATGLLAMNGKLDRNGAQPDHLRQVTAESLVFGIREGIILYESTEKPSWFSDEDNSNVPKTRKTWRDGQPVPDLRAFYFYVTDEMQNVLLADLARQAALVYSGKVPRMTIEMTSKCGFCQFTAHCKSLLTDDEKAELFAAEQRYARSRQAGSAVHRNLLEYLDGVEV